MSSLPSAPARDIPCDGLETVYTEDGPEHSACLRPCCTGRAVVRERIARTGDPFLGATAPADEEF